LVRSRGFEPYLALEAQTLLEINSGIIEELKTSDCYLLVNFCRETLPGGNNRGSLFSNQELAIAYAFGFRRLLVINQEGVASEGMLRYIGVNTERFRDYSDCVEVVGRALDRTGWRPGYSRLLRADGLRFSTELISYDGLLGRFLYIDIQNLRPDIAALEATGRLRRYGLRGGVLKDSEQRSPLKTTGKPGYAHTIFPTSWESFDLLCISPGVQEAVPGMIAGLGSGNANASTASSPMFGIASAASGSIYGPRPGRSFTIFLNNALDVTPLPALSIGPGTWILQYEFFAIDFPMLEVEICLTLDAAANPAAEIVSQGLVRAR
jgi:hypothetical protein